VRACDVLPSVDVDRSRIEHLDPEKQGELTDEFAACFSEELFLCRVYGIWLLFVFLVCGVMVLSMTVCLEFLCLFGIVVLLFWKLVSVSCLLLCATVCELRTRRNSQVLEIADCVSLERVDYLSYLSLLWCIESELYCMLESCLYCCIALV